MTFLELCQAVAEDSGLISHGNLPATVADASGRWGDCVRFTAQAWRDIQRDRSDWLFLRSKFVSALQVAKMDYSPSDFGIAARFGKFSEDRAADGFLPMRMYDPVLGAGSYLPLSQITPEMWEMMYGRGIPPLQQPVHYALFGGKLWVGAVPDKAYVFIGEYTKGPQKLILDNDVPDLPEAHHEVIKWKAMMKNSAKRGAFSDRAVAQAEYSQAVRSLINEQTGRVEMAGTLA